MARPQSSEMYAESAGSWLGAVTSIVGILVVLVMLAGARAKPAIAPPVDTISPAERELASAKSSAVSVERDVHEVERQAQIVEAEMIARGSERLQLASLLSAAEQVIARKRGELDSAARRQYELDHRPRRHHQCASDSRRRHRCVLQRDERAADRRSHLHHT